MTPSQRIVLNTIATYARTVFGMALGLFSGRWVYQTLGEVDYGLMAVVGGLVTFVMFFQGVAVSSCTRFFAFSVGKGDVDETNHWFNTSLSIHVLLPVVLIAIGWPIAEWAIGSFINIPSVRLNTARWVFRLSLINAFWGMVATPYIAMYLAYQRIYEVSIFSIFETVLNFFFVYFLTMYKGDAWLLYAGGTVLIHIGISLVQVVRARYLYHECTIRFARWYQLERLKKVFSFAGWQLFGSMGALLRGNGISILLNKFFNPTVYPAVNASFSLAGTVSNYTQTMASALLGAFTPAITSTEGSGDRLRMLHMANQASKFGTWLILIFAVPVMLEVDNLLALWLKNPPVLAGTFVWLILAQFLVERITFGYMVAVNAVGRIAGYQATLGTCYIMTLPIAWLFLHYGAPPVSVCWAIVLTSTLCSIGRVWLARPLIGASARVWMRRVLFPILIVMFAAFAGGTLAKSIWCQAGWKVGFPRICFTTLMTFWGTLVSAWFLMLDEQERLFIANNVTALRRRYLAVRFNK